MRLQSSFEHSGGSADFASRGREKAIAVAAGLNILIVKKK